MGMPHTESSEKKGLQRLGTDAVGTDLARKDHVADQKAARDGSVEDSKAPCYLVIKYRH